MQPPAPPAYNDEYGKVTSLYYDGTYAPLRNPSGDVEFYRSLARDCGAPVLELGCGTGRVLLPIAQDGGACTGLDASPGMLEALRQKTLPSNLRLVQAAMQRFDLSPDRFRLIYSAFRVFQHLYTVEDQLACLACVRRHLAPGGCFAFDVFNPRLERLMLAEEPEAEDARFEQDGVDVIRYATVRRDQLRQLIHVFFRYERRRADKLLGSETVDIRMRYYFRYELEHLLARAGFGEIRIFGDFDRRPYESASNEMVVIAR